MFRALRTASLLALALPLAACPSLSDVASPGSSKTTFPSVWINASWSGGRTGTPLEVKSVSPTTWVGALCPASSLLIENHVTTYNAFPLGDALIITSHCGNTFDEVAVCRTSGSGGGASTIPICAIDPRQTISANLDIQPHLTQNVPHPFGTTPLGLDINVFYCSNTSHLNLGEVKGKAPTDCVEN